MNNKEPFFFLSKNLKEIKVIVENIIFETNGCGIIYGDKKTGKTAFAKYLAEAGKKRRDFTYIPAEDIDFKEIEGIKNNVIIIDNAHLLKRDQINAIKPLCDENFIIFIVDKEYLPLLREYLKDKSPKFSLEIKPISFRELEALFEGYIKHIEKPIYKNKEIVKYIYELSGGKLGEIFDYLKKLNDLVYYFSLKITYKEKIKYLTIFLAFLVFLSLFLGFLYYTTTYKDVENEEKKPVVEGVKKKIELPSAQIKVKEKTENQTHSVKSVKEQLKNKDIPKEETEKDLSREGGNNLYGMVKASVVNVRQEPSLDAPVVAKLKRFDTFKVVEKKEGWVKINTGSFSGWIKENYIAIVKPGYAVVKAYVLNLRKEPSTKSDILVKLNSGEIVKLTNQKKGRWRKIIYTFDNISLEGWASELFLYVPEEKPTNR